MTTMDQIHHIRELYYEQGKNISEIAAITGLNWKTVAKYVDMTDFNPPAPKSAAQQQSCPKLNPFKPLIDLWLIEDKKAPRKQRHTAKRVYERLKKEAESFDCSYRLVADYVKEKKKILHLENKDSGKTPLIHRPGEAQCDFGSADFYENGRKHSGKYLVLSFPYSNQGFYQLLYGENMECLLEAMDAIFRHIGGVPEEIWFDNTSTIVTEVLKGGGRELTERFIRFREHYGFKSVFCNPASGWEKGSVENKVGYSRRNFLVPVPRFLSLADYNVQALKEADLDGERDHYRHDETIRERFEKDCQALMPLPQTAFELSGFLTVTTNNWGKFTLYKGKHEYSVSPKHTNTVVSLKLTASTVTVLDENLREIVTHRRLYGDDKQESMEWLPYLGYVSRHPRSLMNTGIFSMMPSKMQEYLKECPGTDRGKILKILAELTKRTGFESALSTIDQAIAYRVMDADSLQNLYRRLYADVPELPPITMHSEIPQLQQMSADLAAYDRCLLGGGVASNG